ncbi:DUF6290 family protein [Bartonella sp. DGB2]|uniref:type II toxin-antitoxin system RelB family antitoxin n=1 Tax=Bartonella sp. DGB2 TaxID=3388426 RepID=UPI00399030EC
MLAVRLPEDLEQRLSQLAKQTGRSKSFYLREALNNYIDDLEDLYLAEQRMTELRSGKSKAIPLKDVLADYDMGH